MTRVLYVILIGAIFCGCGASRRTMKSQTEATRETADAIHTEADTKITERTATQTDLSKDEEVVTEVVEFDTSRPANPATGTPPVKRTIRQTRRAAIKTQEVATTDTEAAAETTTDIAAAAKEQTTAKAEEHTRRGLNGLQQLLCYTGTAVLVGLLLRLVVRRLRRR
ncbi:hypothetical protein [Alistipes sp.]|uniref:hypothetical protein n=1 Tax=Alistipes sp. TaxID=1872444 RepID=UPI003AB5A849